MNTEKLLIDHEIRKIAALLGLQAARFYLLFTSSLCSLYFILHHYTLHCIYVFLFTLIAPFFMELLPKNEPKSTCYLPRLQQYYNFNPIKHHSLMLCFWGSNLILIILVYKIYEATDLDFVASVFPMLMLFGNVVCYLSIYYYYQFRFRYQLIHNQW